MYGVTETERMGEKNNRGGKKKKRESAGSIRCNASIKKNTGPAAAVACVQEIVRARACA